MWLAFWYYKNGIQSTNSRYKQTVKAIRLISIDQNEGTKMYMGAQSPSQYSVETDLYLFA